MAGIALILLTQALRRWCGSVVEYACPSACRPYWSISTTSSGMASARARRRRCTAAKVPLAPPPTTATDGVAATRSIIAYYTCRTYRLMRVDRLRPNVERRHP
jgi:hypothetical protein